MTLAGRLAATPGGDGRQLRGKARGAGAEPAVMCPAAQAAIRRARAAPVPGGPQCLRLSNPGRAPPCLALPPPAPPPPRKIACRPWRIHFPTMRIRTAGLPSAKYWACSIDSTLPQL